MPCTSAFKLLDSDDCKYLCYWSTHTHTRLTALFPGLPRWAGTRKVTLIWIFVTQETVSGSGISSAVCKSAPQSRQITTPAPPPLSFLQAGCPSCCPTNSVKALKAKSNGALRAKIYYCNILNKELNNIFRNCSSSVLRFSGTISVNIQSC